jgi:putative transposase
MPWKVRGPVEERADFVRMADSGDYVFSDLCRLFGVSRKTGYKRLRMWRELGEAGLLDQSRAAHHHPNATPAVIQEQLVRVRQAHPDWGPQMILDRLRLEQPEIPWPAASTIGGVLDRAGLIHKRKRHRAVTPPTRPVLPPITGPNILWNMDFMGQFRTGDRKYCYALTISDTGTRSLLLFKGFLSPSYVNTRTALERVFREYGLPEAIRSDNGEPFISYRSLGGLSRLGAWLTKLGVAQIRTRPGCPQDNGIHERLHRTVRAKTTRPPASSLFKQQPLFDTVRHEYNHIRPHRSLGGVPPMSLYTKSPRRLPRKLGPMEYPGHFEVRSVRINGTIKWKSQLFFLSEVLSGERIGLEETNDGIWTIRFGPLVLGFLNERKKKIEG